MRILLLIVFCLGLVGCAGQATDQIPPETEAEARARAQRALLDPEEFQDVQQMRKEKKPHRRNELVLPSK